MNRTLERVGIAALLIVLTFCLTLGKLSAEETKERLVLLPIQGENLSMADLDLFQDAIKEGFSNKYEIFSGEQVQAKLQKFAINSCTSDECLEKIAIAFNGHLVGRGFVNKEDKDYFLRIQIKDVFTDKDVFTKTDGCSSCSKSEIMKKFKAMTSGGASFSSSVSSAVEYVSPVTSEKTTGEGSVTRITPKVSGDSGSTIAALFLDSSPSGATVYLGDTVAGETPYQNMGLKAGQTIHVMLKKDDYHPKALELKLSGGTNEVDTIQLTSMYGSVNVTSEPAGADVYLAGKKVGETPYKNPKVLSGTYSLALKKEYYHSVEGQSLRVEDEKEARKHIALSANFGSLEVTSEPQGAGVYLAGKKVGETPYKNSKALSGAYLLSVRKDLHFPLENERMVVEDGKATRKHVVLNADFGVFSVASSPADATLVVKTQDGKKAFEGKTPGSMKLKPGSYAVTLEKNGYAPLSYTVNVMRNGNQTIDAASAVLRKLEGQIIVSSVPYEKGAEVRVDGELKGVVPATLTLSAGKHEIKIKGKKLQGKKKITVKDRETVTVQVDIKQGGENFTNSIGMSFVFIESGTFMMGSPEGESDRGSDETPHRATLTRGYYMQTTEVTQGQWKKVMGNNPSKFKDCGDDCPVEQVSWNDIQEFIIKLNRMKGHNRYRLPTEAEWEYACRAGSDTPYANDNSLDSMGWYDGNSGSKTHTVAQKKANDWGLYDMHGNVYEWCQDWYGDYPSGSVTDSEGLSSGASRVLRGGCWDILAIDCRSAYRYRNDPGNRINIIGFRLALSPNQ